jgi:hypothetical protein
MLKGLRRRPRGFLLVVYCCKVRYNQMMTFTRIPCAHVVAISISSSITTGRGDLCKHNRTTTAVNGGWEKPRRRERTLIQVEGEKNDSILLVNTPVVRNAVCNKGRVDRIDQFPLIRNHRSPPNSSACGCPGRCRCHHPLRPQSQCQDRIRYGLDVPLPDEQACSSPACQSSCHESRAR